jgi:tetratricopeptide (TPR) repeat protein
VYGFTNHIKTLYRIAIFFTIELFVNLIISLDLNMLRQFLVALSVSVLAIGCSENIFFKSKNLDETLSSEEVGKIAKEVTVLIEGCNSGSGVIVKKDGNEYSINTYSILTAYHVVQDVKIACRILTSDGKLHKISESTVPVAGVDLAILKFQSDNTYQVAELDNAFIPQVGQVVYVAGAPGATEAIPQRVIQLLEGKVVGSLTDPTQSDGYSLIYDNKTSFGVSGGPVLNTKGLLIGIHGRGDRNRQGDITGQKLGILIQMYLQSDGITAKSQPSSAEGYYEQGQTRRDQGDLKGAIADYSRAINLKSDYAGAYVQRGLSYSNLEDYEKAIVDYSQAIQINPKNAATYNNRCVAYTKLREYEKAIADCSQSIRFNNPELYLPYNNRGLVYYMIGKFETAIDDYSTAIRLNPNYANAYSSRGLAYRNVYKDEKAIADYSRSIQLNPNDPIPYNNRGSSYSLLKDYKRAIADYSESIRLNNPELDIPYTNRGFAYYQLKNYEKAIADYSNAIQLDPSNANAYYHRGNAYKNLGASQRAIQDYEKAADLYQQQGRFDDYQDALDQIQQLSEQ